MAYTKFGELMRIMRIKNHEVMGDTAKLLNVSIPFLSAVENGKKNVPPTWINLLAFHYKLTTEEIEELSNAADFSKTQVKFDLRGTTDSKREAALQLARSFSDIDDITAKKIADLLKGVVAKNGLQNKADKS